METKRNGSVPTTATGLAIRNPAAPEAVPVAVATEMTGAMGGMSGVSLSEESGVGASILAGATASASAAPMTDASKKVTSRVNANEEHAFWRNEFRNRPYFTPGTPYDQYGPAFQYGWVSFANHMGKTFFEVEPQLGRDWENRRGQSKLTWNHAKDAVIDAWERLEKAACGAPCVSP